MQSHARLVIIGAGIVGCSVAYHLTKRGWQDIVVVDQGPLFDTGGSSSHAPGLVFQTNASKLMTTLAKETVELYGRLELDGEPCWYGVGSLEVAFTEARWQDLHRKLGFAKSYGLDASLISPQETLDLVPLLNPSVIHGAYFVPSDGIAKPVRAAEAMSRYSKAHGAAFYGNTMVTNIVVKGGRVQAVETTAGRIAADQVLICAGIWGPRVGRMAGVSIPLLPVQHQYTRTAPLPALQGETREVDHPIVRHQDYAMYFRQEGDCYGIGNYKHEPLPVEADDILSPAEAERAPAMMDFTPEHFTVARQAADELFPALRNLELTDAFNGMFSFTPDGLPILGEAPQVDGLWIAEAVWITHGGGVGSVVAEWMAEGMPSLDLREADYSRFPAHAHTPAYVRARGAQQYREVYDIIHPQQQLETPRNVRCSPFHPRLEALGAVFFESAGWERPQWFEANKDLIADDAMPVRTGWEAQHWSPIQAGEHRATRERVAMYDLTAFTKIEVSGPGALDYLQSISANQIDRPVGKVVYTAMLNRNGGIQCDLTLTRLARDRFLVLTGGASGIRDLAWLRSHAPSDDSVTIDDVTSEYCGIGLWGPRARDVLQQVCADNVSNRAFPYFASKALSIGTAPARALRVSYVGELGWEIYVPTEYGLGTWDALWEAGQHFGMIAAGGGAFDSLRLEKGYRLWGADIHTDYNPYEAGLGWAVKLNKGDFIGREALMRSREAGIERRLCCLTLDDPSHVVMGKEPILDGERVLGYVTSANTGYTVGKSIAYGYLPIECATEGTSLTIDYFGRRYEATVTEEPLFDPSHARLRS
ncbi:MAG: FAD-dependent oxidoreductase [Chloroflexi bacterium]|nr:FAD-dependent oxidoreductase [Chloroflexota bacterium]